jgi:DNA-binding Lrp family transcriptional regulator
VAERLKVKDSLVSLDKTDLEILKALQNDSRETYSTLGKNLGIAHSTVYDRVKMMEQHGVIKRYAAIVDAEKIGIKSVMAVMTVFANPKEIEKVAEKLALFQEVLDVYSSLSEELLIIARVTAASQQDLHEFIANSVAPLPGVLRIRTSIVSKKFKETEILRS